MQLCFLGAGKMATAMAAGIIDKSVFAAHWITATDVYEEVRAEFARITGAHVLESNATAVAGAETVVLSVKPQEAKQVLEPLKGAFEGKLLISIAAGLRLSKLAEWTGSDRIVRVMPNTPATVRLGASVYACSAGVSTEDRQLTSEILGAIGIAYEMDEEKLDAVTALSGSGPAFLFAYVEAMVDGATKLGLEPDVALDLTVQTIAGAAKMLNKRLGTPEELRRAVTSREGTTAAGLASFKEDDFHGTIIRCLEAATKRSIELGE